MVDEMRVDPGIRHFYCRGGLGSCWGISCVAQGAAQILLDARSGYVAEGPISDGCNLERTEKHRPSQPKYKRRRPRAHPKSGRWEDRGDFTPENGHGSLAALKAPFDWPAAHPSKHDGGASLRRVEGVGFRVEILDLAMWYDEGVSEFIQSRQIVWDGSGCGAWAACPSSPAASLELKTCTSDAKGVGASTSFVRNKPPHTRSGYFNGTRYGSRSPVDDGSAISFSEMLCEFVQNDDVLIRGFAHNDGLMSILQADVNPWG
jgi:hypothetical protein